MILFIPQTGSVFPGHFFAKSLRPCLFSFHAFASILARIFLENFSHRAKFTNPSIPRQSQPCRRTDKHKGKVNTLGTDTDSVSLQKRVFPDSQVTDPPVSVSFTMKLIRPFYLYTPWITCSPKIPPLL